MTSSPGAVVSSLMARLAKEFDREETIGASVSGSGRGDIPKELAWTEYSSSLGIGSALLHLDPGVKIPYGSKARAPWR